MKYPLLQKVSLFSFTFNTFSPSASLVTTVLIFVPIFSPFPARQINGFLQSYNLMHVASFSCVLSSFMHVQLFVTRWTLAPQASLSMGFSRQEHQSRLQCPPPGNLPDPGIKALSLLSLALAGGFFTTSATWEAPYLGHFF